MQARKDPKTKRQVAMPLEVLTPALRDVMDLEDTCRRGYLVVYPLQKNYVAL